MLLLFSHPPDLLFMFDQIECKKIYYSQKIIIGLHMEKDAYFKKLLKRASAAKEPDSDAPPENKNPEKEEPSQNGPIKKAWNKFMDFLDSLTGFVI